ncbi:MAG: hypothetical protein ACOVNU_04945 [Candidatus Kapaibacteriota bacterium]|jgi:hypothetical protein
MSADYVSYLLINKERINQEHKMYAEFWMRENVRINEEFPELSSIEKVSKMADEWRSYTETPEYKAKLEAKLEAKLVNTD